MELGGTEEESCPTSESEENEGRGARRKLGKLASLRRPRFDSPILHGLLNTAKSDILTP